jgi:hypothetical protein
MSYLTYSQVTIDTRFGANARITSKTTRPCLMIFDYSSSTVHSIENNRGVHHYVVLQNVM